MMKRSPLFALGGIVVLGLLAVLLSFLSLRSAMRYQQDTRGVALGSPPADLPVRSASPYGVNVALDKDLPGLERSLDLARNGGLTWLRQEFPWVQMEPQRGVYRWDDYDRIVDAATARGLKIIAVLDTSPAWARTSKVETSPPDSMVDYGSFVAAFAAHFRGRVGFIQIWDQPNVFPNWGDFWASPAEYVAMLKVAYAQARAANPDVLVLAGGLAPTVADDQWNLNDVTFLRRMYALGAKGNFDILAAKPYGFWSGPDDRSVDAATLNFSRLVFLRDVMVKAGDSGRPVWAVEMGWNALPDGWKGQPSPWGSDTEDKQAQRLVDAMRRAQVEWPWLDVMVVNGLRFPGAAAGDPLHGFALVDEAWQPRRAYSEVQKLARGPQVAGVGRYAPTTLAATYSAGWTVIPGPSANQPIYRTDVAGAELTFRFHGTDLVMYLDRQADAGRMLVWIDDAAVDRLPRDGTGTSFVDPAHLPNPGMGATILTDTLADGDHVLRIRVVSWLGHSTVTLGGFEVVRFAPATALYLKLALLALGALLCCAGVVVLMPRLPWAAWDGLVERMPLFGQLAALAAALGLYYVAPWLPLAAIGALAFAALAFTRLDLALALTALTFPFYLYPRHIGGQVFSLPEVLTLLCLGAWLVRGLARREWNGRGDLRWPVLFFLAVALLSLRATIDMRLSLRELRTVVIEPVVFYVLAVAAFDRPGRLPRTALLWALALAGGAAALLSLGQYATGHVITAEGARRALGPYASPNNLGLLLERVLPLALALTLYYWGRRSSAPSSSPSLPVSVSPPLSPSPRLPVSLSPRLLLPAACCLLIILSLFLTYSVGAWLGAMVGLLVFAALRGRKQVALLIVALAAAAILSLPLLKVDRVVSHLNVEGQTTAIRLVLWQSALEMLRANPIGGVGLDGFLEQYRGVYIRPAALREPNLSHPHNLALEWWLFLGILGVPTLLWLLGGFVWRAWQSLRSLDAGQVLIVQGAVAAMAAAVAHGMVDRFYFGAPDLAFIFFTLLVLVQRDTGEQQIIASLPDADMQRKTAQ